MVFLFSTTIFGLAHTHLQTVSPVARGVARVAQGVYGAGGVGRGSGDEHA